MTTWEEVLLKAKSAAGTVSKKTTELADTVKLKTRSAEIQKELAATFEGMGRLLYDSRQSGEDVTPLLDESMKQVGTLQEDLRKVEWQLLLHRILLMLSVFMLRMAWTSSHFTVESQEKPSNRSKNINVK